MNKNTENIKTNKRMKTVGPDPHIGTSTGTGSSREGVKHDDEIANRKIKLTKEEQDIWDGKKGKVLAKVMKTVVGYGNSFGADKLVDLGGNPHTVLMLGPAALQPLLDLLNECADAGLKSYAPYTVDPKARDLINIEMTPELALETFSTYPLQEELQKVHLRLGAMDRNYWSCTCYWPEVGNAPPTGTNLAWSESSAVNYSNSVLGARSNRNSGGMEMLCNILGKAPHFGLMTDEGRSAKWLIDVRVDSEPHWSVLGSAIGMKVMEDVPYIIGVDTFLGQVDGISMGKLKDMGAATATNGAVGLYHVDKITPEAVEQGRDLLAKGYQTYVIDEAEIERVRKNYPNLWSKKNAKPTRAFVGCPHNSFHQLYDWISKITHELSVRGQEKVKTPTYLFASPLVQNHFEDEYPEMVRDAKRAGVKFSAQCALLFATMPSVGDGEFMVTNSNKAREYSTSRFFLDEDLLEIILTGEVTEAEYK